MTALAVAALLATAAAGCGQDQENARRGRHSPLAKLLRIEVGHGERSAVILRPRRATRALPLVIFIHGIFATEPRYYGAWLKHLVGEGNEVIYPRYQEPLTPPAAFLANAIAGIRAALPVEPVRPGTLVVAGHSAGGALSADYAASARGDGLPVPRLVFAVYPGRGLRGVPLRIPEMDPAGIPRSTRIVALAGARDRIVGTTVAREIVDDATQVPRARRAYRLLKDPHIDHHLAPLRGDAAARRAFWGPLDRMIKQARRG